MQDLLSKMCCNCSEVSTLLDGTVTFCAGTNYFCGLCWQSGTWNVVRAGSNWKAQLHNPCRTFSQHTFSVCTCEHHQVKRNQKSCPNLLRTRKRLRQSLVLSAGDKSGAAWWRAAFLAWFQGCCNTFEQLKWNAWKHHAIYSMENFSECSQCSSVCFWTFFCWLT